MLEGIPLSAKLKFMILSTVTQLNLAASRPYREALEAKSLLKHLSGASTADHDAVRAFVRNNLLPAMWTEEEEVGAELLSTMMAEGYKQEDLERALRDALLSSAGSISIRKRTRLAKVVYALSTRFGLSSLLVFGAYASLHVWSYLHRPELEAWLIVAAPAAALVLAAVVLPAVYWLLGTLIPVYRRDR
ncbi:MAG: hypothetical protein EBV34_11470 [Betaproteobacteria bacterium]|nr:hypothetical protein [Betaproteobacteria bacterium]NDE53461.1 hypothetical protein [Actinomycetota bacterium]